MANIFGRQVVVLLTNKSGGGVIAGDVVIPDGSNDTAFTTTTSASVISPVWVAQETIASNATGRVLIGGYAALVNVNASVTRGHFGATHTVAKQAADAGTARTAGTFCQFLTGGTTPTAYVYPTDLLGSSLTNPMSTTGDIIYSSDNSGTPARRGVGAATTVLHGGTTPAYSAVVGADLNPDNILPWHILVIPFLQTPDATTGTWAWGTVSLENVGYAFGRANVSTVDLRNLTNTTGAQNDAVAWDVVLAAGTWDCRIIVRKSTNTAIITLNQDGASQGTADTYAAAPASGDLLISGWTVATTGKHRMEIKAATRNASNSTGWYLGIFSIEFRRTA